MLLVICRHLRSFTIVKKHLGFTEKLIANRKALWNREFIIPYALSNVIRSTYNLFMVQDITKKFVFKPFGHNVVFWSTAELDACTKPLSVNCAFGTIYLSSKSSSLLGA